MVGHFTLYLLSANPSNSFRFLSSGKKSLQPHWNYSWNCNVIFSVSIRIGNTLYWWLLCITAVEFNSIACNRKGCSIKCSVVYSYHVDQLFALLRHNYLLCVYLSYLFELAPLLMYNVRTQYEQAHEFAKIQISFMELCIQWSESKCWWVDSQIALH